MDLEFDITKKFKITGDVTVEKVRGGFLKVLDDFGTVTVLGQKYNLDTIHIKSPSEHAVIFQN
jgi:carbonic anhydrase